MNVLKRAIVPLVIVALVVAAGFAMFGGSEKKTLTAHFSRAIAIYEGSDMRILGVPVGTVVQVTPSGTEVIVTMEYDASIKIPTDAKAVIVSPSIVGDRYVQLTPVYQGGDVIEDNTVLDIGRTAVPLELDQVYSSIDQLTVALGPTGANKNGAFTDLLETTAANFGGQGAKFHQTIQDFSKLSETLDNNKEELFGSSAELEGFIGTLARNDKTVRAFNQSLASVSTMLSGERGELSASLKNLAEALGQVGTFVRDNREVLGRNIKGLNRVFKVLVKQRVALDETLKIAPLALNNLALTYNPQTGTLDTNGNVGELGNQIGSDPATLLCGLVNQGDPTGALCDLIQQGQPRAATFGQGKFARSRLVDQFDLSLGGLVGVTR